MANSDKQVNKLEKMLHQLIIGLLDAAVLLGASIVNNQALRWIYIALAVIFTIWLLINMLKDHFLMDIKNILKYDFYNGLL